MTPREAQDDAGGAEMAGRGTETGAGSSEALRGAERVAVTGADMQRAAQALNYGPREQVSPMDQEYVEQIAAALAEERAKARAPFLAICDSYEADALHDHYAGHTTAAEILSEVRTEASR